MLEKFLNKRVEILVTLYSTHTIRKKGVVTKVDSEFIEIDNNRVFNVKHIISIEGCI